MSRTSITQYGRVPYDMVDIGFLDVMTGADAKVYIAIAAHVNKHYQTTIGRQRLASLTGLCLDTTRIATKRLTQAGLIEVKTGRGMGHANTYKLVTKPQRRMGVLTAQNPSDDTAETPAPSHQNPSADTVNPQPSKGVTDKNRVITEQEQINDADGGLKDNKQEVQNALAAKKIKEPKLSQLAQIQGLTPTVISQLAKRVQQSAKNPAGLLIRLIEKEGPQLIKDEEVRRQRAEAREAQQEWKKDESKAELERVKAERLELDAFINKLTDEQLDQYKRQAIDEVGAAPPRAWRNAAPRKQGLYMSLKAMIRKIAESRT